MKNKNGGITLLVLTITIIVLLILAGITLNLVLGENGILAKATLAAEQHNIAAAQEQINLKLAEFQTEFYEKVYYDQAESVNTSAGDWIYTNYGNQPIQTEEYEFEITLPEGQTSADEENPYVITIRKNPKLKGKIVGNMAVNGQSIWNDEVVPSENEPEPEPEPEVETIMLTATPSSQTAEYSEKQDVTITVTSTKNLNANSGKYAWNTSSTTQPTEWQTVTLNEVTGNAKQKTGQITQTAAEQGDYYLWVQVKDTTEHFGPYKLQSKPTVNNLICVLKSKSDNDTKGVVEVGSNKAFTGWKVTYKVNSGTETEIEVGTTTTTNVVKGDIVTVKYSKENETDVTKTLNVDELKEAYTLKYNANGGTNAPAEQVQYDNNSFTVTASEPEKDGNAFEGWYLNAECTGTKYSSGDSITVNTSNKEITLYAKWGNITAEMVEFTPEDTSWTGITNVKQALDYLYDN